MFSSFVRLMGVIIRISSSISPLSPLSSLPNELDIRFQELNYPEKLSSNKTSSRRPKIYMTVFLIQALETALTFNLCFKIPHQPKLKCDMPFCMLWFGSGHDNDRAGEEGQDDIMSVTEYKEETQNNLQPQHCFHSWLLAPCRCCVTSSGR